MTLLESAAAVALPAAVMLVVGALVVRMQQRRKAATPIPDYWGLDPDDRKWEREATELAHTELKEVRESAKAWAGSIAALLGIGGTVAFVKGEDAFSKLSAGEGNLALCLTVAAFLFAAVGIAFATFASQGAPRRYDVFDGWTLRNASRESAQRALTQLLWSRVLVVIAALALFGGFVISWQAGIASEDPASGVKAIAVTSGDVVRCGELGSDPEGALFLTIASDEIAVVESGVEVVESCPKKE